MRGAVLSRPAPLRPAGPLPRRKHNGGAGRVRPSRRPLAGLRARAHHRLAEAFPASTP